MGGISSGSSTLSDTRSGPWKVNHRFRTMPTLFGDLSISTRCSTNFSFACTSTVPQYAPSPIIAETASVSVGRTRRPFRAIGIHAHVAHVAGVGVNDVANAVRRLPRCTVGETLLPGHQPPDSNELLRDVALRASMASKRDWRSSRQASAEGRVPITSVTFSESSDTPSWDYLTEPSNGCVEGTRQRGGAKRSAAGKRSPRTHGWARRPEQRQLTTAVRTRCAPTLTTEREQASPSLPMLAEARELGRR